MNMTQQITAMNRSLLVTRYGYAQDLVDALEDKTASALRVCHHRLDEKAGITWCVCGKRSHGYCD